MVIDNIKEAAEASGINGVVTNSKERIETQLNRLTKYEDSPAMLISWDLEASLEFNENNFLNNPTFNVTYLLMSKPESLEKEDHEKTAQEMATYFQKFIQNLNSLLTRYNTSGNNSLSGISMKIVPSYGLGKHAGVTGSFTMIDEISNC
jgi:hypothetical protein